MWPIILASYFVLNIKHENAKKAGNDPPPSALPALANCRC